MCRTIQTVPDLWREWTVGWGSGPAIQTLEQAYGSRWRLSPTERVFFGRRKVIVDEIKRRTTSRMSAIVAAEELETVRRRLEKSLNSLIKWLKENDR